MRSCAWCAPAETPACCLRKVQQRQQQASGVPLHQTSGMLCRFMEYPPPKEQALMPKIPDTDTAFWNSPLWVAEPWT